MQKIVFTPRFIESLKSGKAADPQTPGLTIEADEGALTWRYKRKVKGTTRVYKKVLGTYPTVSIADARAAAQPINVMVEAGVDPREAAKIEAIETMTVEEAHDRYMIYVRAGERRELAASTIDDKERLWRVFAPVIGQRQLQSVTDDDLWAVVQAKADEGARGRANRIAAEMKVFFSWCVSRAGKNAGVILKVDPSTSLNGNYYGLNKRKRYLSDAEISLFLRALSEQDRVYQRYLGLLLLTGCRRSEVGEALSSEYVDGVWTIPGDQPGQSRRTKNNETHVIPLASWGRSMMETDTRYLIPSNTADKPFSRDWINRVTAKVRTRMMELGSCAVPPFIVHDLRRTLRSNVLPLGLTRDTGEAMLNHKKTGLDEVYDHYDMMKDKREGYARWEKKLVAIARKAGVADALAIPKNA